VIGDPGQHIREPGLGIDVVELGRLNQRQHNCGLNRLEGDRRDRVRLLVAGLRRDVGKLEQLASRIRPTSSFLDCLSIGLVERIEPDIGIGQNR